MYIANRVIVAMLFAAATTAVPAQNTTDVPGIVCHGEEPSWTLDAGRTTAVYSELATRGRREVVFRGSLKAMSRLTPPVIVWRGDSTHLPKETLVAIMRQESCKSTMADGPAFAYSAVVTLKSGEARAGCCNLRTGSEPAPRAGAKPRP